MGITGFRLSIPLEGSNKNELSRQEAEVSDCISNGTEHL